MDDSATGSEWDVLFLYSGFFRSGAITGAEIAEGEFLRALIQFRLFRSIRVFSRLASADVDRLRTHVGSDPDDPYVAFYPVQDMGTIARASPPTLALCPYTFQHQLDPLRIERSFPISGFVHTISDLDAKVGMAKNLRMADHRFDTAICPTKSVARVLHAIAAEISTDPGTSPQTHIVPLGVDADAFCPAEAAVRAERRDRLGVTQDECAFLYVGRLSPWTKMDLLPLLDAFARACEGTSRPLRLLLAGQEQAGGYVSTLRARATDLGIADRLSLLDGIDRDDLPALFSAADAFVSPSDNRQETFGLTLVEAMASALPIIAADWNGYREVIDDAGLLVPTIAAQADRDMANDLLYRGPLPTGAHFSQITAVSVSGMASAMIRLAADAPLHDRLCRTALSRYKHEFRWNRVLDRLLPIWDEQVRTVAVSHQRPRAKPELTIDTERCFSHYPSRSWSPNLIVRPGRAATVVHDRILAGMAEVAAIDWPLCIRLRDAIETMPGIAIGRLKSGVGAPDGTVARCTAFLVKHGLIELDWTSAPANLIDDGSNNASSDCRVVRE